MLLLGVGCIKVLKTNRASQELLGVVCKTPRKKREPHDGMNHVRFRANSGWPTSEQCSGQLPSSVMNVFVAWERPGRDPFGKVIAVLGDENTHAIPPMDDLRRPPDGDIVSLLV